jgi:hypothetical protein
VRTRAVAASILALLLAVLAGVGAPPSEFVTRDSRWWTVDPLMFPALFAGVVLACIALIASGIGSALRAAAWLCLLASLSTAAGTVIAGGISDHRAQGARWDRGCCQPP